MQVQPSLKNLLQVQGRKTMLYSTFSFMGFVQGRSHCIAFSLKYFFSHLSNQFSIAFQFSIWIHIEYDFRSFASGLQRVDLLPN